MNNGHKIPIETEVEVTISHHSGVQIGALGWVESHEPGGYGVNVPVNESKPWRGYPSRDRATVFFTDGQIEPIMDEALDCQKLV